MFQCVPSYTVSYYGEFHRAGAPFPIRGEDAELMREHGEVLETPGPDPEQEKKSKAR